MDGNAYHQSVEFIRTLDRSYLENANVGWLYVVRNMEFKKPLLKVGMTTRPPYDRVAELASTGVPGTYEVIYFVHVTDTRYGESIAHQALAEHRYQPNKEFFEVSISQAVRVLDWVADHLPVLRSQRNKGSRNPRSKPIPQAFPSAIVSCPSCSQKNRVHPLAIPTTAKCGTCSYELVVR